MTATYSIRLCHWQEDKSLLQQVRFPVFVEEQSVPVELEWDEKDALALHWLACDENNQPIGTVRMLDDGHIGRMAVLASHRQYGIGKALLLTAISHARQLALTQVYLHAQVQALGFYEKQGFVAHGDEFMDAGIPHFAMRLRLTETRVLAQHGGDFAVNNIASTALLMIGQVHSHLRILSTDLDRSIFDNEAMVEHFSKLARKSRYTDIRILIINGSDLAKHAHRLLRLQAKLSSSMALRTVSDESHTISEQLIIADQCGLIVQSIKDPAKCWANFNHRASADNKISYFDDLWNRAQENTELRQLEL